MEGSAWVFGDHQWLGHCRDGSGVPVARLGSKGVECSGDDLLSLSLEDDVALCV